LHGEGGRRVRDRVASLDDAALVAAMRADDAYAWSEYFHRYRPVLLAYARRVRLSAGLTDGDVQNALVDELLADEAVRLTGPNALSVPTLGAYLQRAARHRLYNLRRAAARRLKRYGEAATDTTDGAPVVAPLCSEYVLRLSSGPAAVHELTPASMTAPRPPHPSPSDDTTAVDASPVLRLAAALRATTTTDEQLLLAWVAHRVPHRTIAGWLGVSYDVATKRLWRLCRRLRAAAVRHAASLAPEDRHEIERFLRRAGALPPLVAREHLAPPTARASAPLGHVVRAVGGAPAAAAADPPTDDHV
jgi:DNA-directed RNA polymerase specialized sigma24 family protein